MYRYVSKELSVNSVTVFSNDENAVLSITTLSIKSQIKLILINY